MFALCRPKHHGSTPREHPEIFAQSHPPPVDLSVGDIRSQIVAEWLQIAQRSQWRAYRKPPSFFLMVLSLTPYDLTCFFLLKLTIFVATATIIDVAQVLMKQYDLPTTKASYLVQISGPVLNSCQVIVYFKL